MKKLLNQALEQPESLMLVGQGKDSAVYKITASDGREYVMKFSPEPVDNRAVMTAMRALGRANETQALPPDTIQFDTHLEKLIQDRAKLMEEKAHLIRRLEKKSINPFRAPMLHQKISIINAQIKNLIQDINKPTDLSIDTSKVKQIRDMKNRIASDAGVDAAHVAVEPWMGEVVLDGSGKWAAMSANDAVSTIEKSLDDLSKLHDAGLVHGDISPANVSQNGLIDITGFKDGQKVTQDTRGTEGYTAIESTLATQDGEAHLSKEADVYAMGMLIQDMMDVYKLNDQLPGASALVRQMTDLDPDMRPDAQTCKEVWAGIKAHVQQRLDTTSPPSRFTDPSFTIKTKARHAIVSAHAITQSTTTQPTGSLTQENTMAKQYANLMQDKPEEKNFYKTMYLNNFTKAMGQLTKHKQAKTQASQSNRPAALRERPQATQPKAPQPKATNPDPDNTDSLTL